MSCFMEIQQRDNKTLAEDVNSFKTEAKRNNFNSDTATICIFVKGLWHTHNITGKIYKKDPQTLPEVIKLVEKLNVVQQFIATLTFPRVNVMSKNDRCFACGKTGHIGCHCPDGQCYNCKDFDHLAQDCPDKIPPPGTLCHHNKSHSQPCYHHSHRDRLQSLNYRCSQGRCLGWSRSHCQSHHGRNSYNYQRDISHSPSYHHSSSQYPSTD